MPGPVVCPALRSLCCFIGCYLIREMGFCGKRRGIWLLPEWLVFLFWCFTIMSSDKIYNKIIIVTIIIIITISSNALFGDYSHKLTLPSSLMFYSESEPLFYWHLCRLEFSFCFTSLYVFIPKTKAYLSAVFMQLKKKKKMCHNLNGVWQSELFWSDNPLCAEMPLSSRTIMSENIKTQTYWYTMS